MRQSGKILWWLVRAGWRVLTVVLLGGLALTVGIVVVLSGGLGRR